MGALGSLASLEAPSPVPASSGEQTLRSPKRAVSTGWHDRPSVHSDVWAQARGRLRASQAVSQLEDVVSKSKQHSLPIAQSPVLLHGSEALRQVLTPKGLEALLQTSPSVQSDGERQTLELDPQ